ncbi:DUF4440 domain-containing protein [Nocardioides oleivorans]|uniref:DUF4440 domain-containing protein n=1 Tax=Nocardioides oleivorans TaxID=273676 RepID=A0A4Q2RRL3_9ACTN|nr:DUF4440 domain-containing protein [Nocardioides oleivorans]RYB89933.1 DUF4440 domain-containing protein [Nocardioides oleivorans]
MTTTADIAATFFTDYAAALLARDEDAIARMYAVPALVLFPGRAIAVSDRSQTAEFFASSWEQYDGVAEAEPDVTVLASTADAIWADVRWSFDGAERERFCYQLGRTDDEWQVAVLTPLDQPGS